MKLIKKMDGAISIFLCIVLTSLIILSGLLIDGSRVRAGEAQAQAAAENSMRSVLASYDSMLKDLYGLFALSDGSTDNLNEEIEAYMNRTLMTELGISQETIGKKSYDYLKNILVNSGQKDVKFINIFDYGIEDLKAESLYNLAQTEVLGNQIIENMKYRGPRELSENFLDKLGMFKEFGRQSGIMKKKVDIDKELDKIRSDREKLSDAIEYMNNFSTADGGGRIEGLYGDFVNSVVTRAYCEIELKKEEKKEKAAEEAMILLKPELSAALKNVNDIQQQIDSTESSVSNDKREEVQSAVRSLKDSLSTANAAYEQVKSQYDKLENAYEISKNRCEALKKQIDESNKLANERKETIKSLITGCRQKCSEAEDCIEKIITKSQSINSKIKEMDESDLNGDTSDFANQMRLDLANDSKMVSSIKLKEIKSAILKNKEVLERLEAFITQADEGGINGTSIPEKLGRTIDDISEAEVSSYIGTILKYNELPGILKQYLGKGNSNAISYEVKKQVQTDSKETDPRKNIHKIVNDNVKNKDGLSDEKKSNPKEPEDKDLVSKSDILKKDYSKEDAEYIKTVLKGYDNILNSTGNAANQLPALEYGSDELKAILNEADFNNNEEKFSASGLEFLVKMGEVLRNSLEGMRDSLYINEYAMGNFKNILSDKTTSKKQPEKDLSGILKSKRKTLYDGEVEYILTGMKNQQNNIYSVEAQILLVRFALNTLAIYMDAEKVSEALAVAGAISGFTVFGVPIVQTMILLGWSMAESVADVKLIMGGDKIPVYKVKGDWILDETNALKNFALNSAAKAGNTAVDFAESKAEELSKAAIDKIDKVVEEKISFSVDKAFAPLEQGITGDTAEDLSGQLLNKAGSGNEKNESSSFLELQNKITALANEEFSRVKYSLTENIRNASVNEASNLITSAKNDTENLINENVKVMTDKLKEEINSAAAKGADNLKSYIDSSLGGRKENETSMGSSIKASMTAMGYQDYLRLFLLMRGNNSKISRIADLIQLNMRLESGNKDFKLEECNTYIRLKATVSMKYLFMTSAFMPHDFRFKDDSRHRIDLLVYQGY